VKRQRQFVRRDTVPIVGYFDQLAPCFSNRNRNVLRACVEGVLYQFLDHGGRALNDFTAAICEETSGASMRIGIKRYTLIPVLAKVT